eukprot:SAG22_NODE_778_length_7279_cov_3.312256_2_plen_499_part_00
MAHFLCVMLGLLVYGSNCCNAQWGDMVDTVTSRRRRRRRSSVSIPSIVPVDCVGGWQDTSWCPSCGPEGTFRLQTCFIDVPAAGGGRECECSYPGETRNVDCHIDQCPVDCVGGWQDTSMCPCCGPEGTFKLQTCSILVPAMGSGRECECSNPGETRNVDCQIDPCPVDCVGGWQDTHGSTCPSCGLNGTSRLQTCVIVMAASGGGRECECSHQGETRHVDCHVDPCAVNVSSTNVSSTNVSSTNVSSKGLPSATQVAGSVLQAFGFRAPLTGVCWKYAEYRVGELPNQCHQGDQLGSVAMGVGSSGLCFGTCTANTSCCMNDSGGCTRNGEWSADMVDSCTDRTPDDVLNIMNGNICWQDRCRHGFESIGTTCTKTTIPPCRDGYEDLGAVCSRTTLLSYDIYPKTPIIESYEKFSCTRFDTGYMAGCRDGLQRSTDALLCYPECSRAGPDGTPLTGVGPLCSATCPTSHAVDLCEIFPGTCGPGGGVACCKDRAVS